MRELIFVDHSGRRGSSMRNRQREDREAEVPRAELAILVDAGDAEILLTRLVTMLAD